MDELTKAVQEIKNGNMEAFDTIQRLTESKARAVIRHYCSDPDDCEDILQDTYIQAYQKINDLENDTSVQAWINAIARNEAKMFLRKNNPTIPFSEMEDDEGNEQEPEDESGKFDPEAVAEKDVIVQAVREVLDSLPEDQRNALLWVYGENITIREVAATLGISENTVKSRLHQGSQKVKAKKAELQKRGVEIMAVPVAALIAMAFDDTAYAAEAWAVAGAAAAAAGGAAAGEVVATGEAAATAGEVMAAGESVAAGEAAIAAGEAAATTTAAAASTTAASTAASTAGLSFGTKIAIAAAVVALGGGAAVGVTAYQHSHAEEPAVETVVETQAPEEIFEEILPPVEEPEEEAEPVYVSVESPQWAEAYIEYMKGEIDYYNHSGYTLIYLDDDDIPELVRVGNNEAEGCRIIRYNDNGLEETQLFRLAFGYYERENLLDNCSGHMGGIYEDFYSIIDGKMTLIGEGLGEQSDPYAPYDEAPDYVYTWNGQPVSREQYSANIDAMYAGHDEANYKSYDYNNLESPISMINLLSRMESGVSQASFETPVISEPASDDLTEGQKAVILKAIPNLLFNYDGKTEIRTEDMTMDEIMSYIYQCMINNYSLSGILTPVDHDPVASSPDSYGYTFDYYDWCDKDSVLKNLGSFLGRTITDDDVRSYGGNFDGIPLFMIDGDAIGILDYASGEQEGITPRIGNYTIENGKLTVSLPYEIEWGGFYGGEIINSLRATLVFNVNPDSFFGYSLESIKFDGNYFDVPAGLSGTVESGTELSGVQSHISGIMASSVLTDNGTKYPPTYMLDGDLTTAWAEGAEYDGIGESITIMLDDTCTVSGITIYNGYQKSSDLYYKNSRPCQISISTSEGQMYPDFELEDKMGAQTITFDEPVETDFVKITIYGVYPGSTYQDTLISEIQLN